MISYLVFALIFFGNPDLPHLKISPTEVVTYPSPENVNATTDVGAWIFMKKIKIISKKYGIHYALVDDEDFELVSKHKWHIHKGHGKTFYAVANIPNPNRPSGQSDIQMHRLVMNFPKCFVDHRNLNGLHNYKTNLRLANVLQNRMNTSVRIDNKCQFKGVSKVPNADTYRAVIHCGGKQINGGRFYDPVQAAKRYNELAIQYFGEFAHLNKIPS